MSTWTSYATDKPTAVGVYRWRVPSVRVPGLVVRFIGHFLERNAGYSTQLAPYFANWDGYRLNIPNGTEWQSADFDGKCREFSEAELSPEGVENVECPYCDKIPIWKAVENGHGGTFIHSEPHRYNSWWLECCRWGSVPRMADPRELARIRNAALSFHAALAP